MGRSKNIKGDDVPSKELLPTFPCDHQLSVELRGALETCSAAEAEALLLSGSKSPLFFGTDNHALDMVSPNGQHVELPGLGHEEHNPLTGPVENLPHES
ncbi:MAG: hypothetical protein ACXV5I_07835 [Halobacteriota archaeon]